MKKTHQQSMCMALPVALQVIGIDVFECHQWSGNAEMSKQLHDSFQIQHFNVAKSFKFKIQHSRQNKHFPNRRFSLEYWDCWVNFGGHLNMKFVCWRTCWRAIWSVSETLISFACKLSEFKSFKVGKVSVNVLRFSIKICFRIRDKLMCFSSRYQVLFNCTTASQDIFTLVSLPFFRWMLPIDDTLSLAFSSDLCFMKFSLINTFSLSDSDFSLASFGNPVAFINDFNSSSNESSELFCLLSMNDDDVVVVLEPDGPVILSTWSSSDERSKLFAATEREFEFASVASGEVFWCFSSCGSSWWGLIMLNDFWFEGGADGDGDFFELFSNELTKSFWFFFLLIHVDWYERIAIT